MENPQLEHFDPNDEILDVLSSECGVPEFFFNQKSKMKNSPKI